MPILVYHLLLTLVCFYCSVMNWFMVGIDYLFFLCHASGMWCSVDGFEESTAHGGSVKTRSVATPTTSTEGMKHWRRHIKSTSPS
jgi:hypothetical protein